MKSKIFSLLFLLVSFSCFAWNGRALEQIQQDGVANSLQSVTLYTGIHKEYLNNLVVELQDGSQWKIHPDHEEAFRSWQMGDRVHIQLCNSREAKQQQHLFELYNHQTKETVSVWFVTYPYHFDYIYSSESLALAPTLRKIYLDLNSAWELWGNPSSLEKFKNGVPVYQGANYRNGKITYFFITDREKSSVYAQACKSQGF